MKDTKKLDPFVLGPSFAMQRSPASSQTETMREREATKARASKRERESHVYAYICMSVCVYGKMDGYMDGVSTYARVEYVYTDTCLYSCVSC